MRKRHALSTMLALTGIMAVPLLIATPVEAGGRDGKKAKTHKRQVQRQTHNGQRRVKLERQVTRRHAAPNRNVFNKTVVRQRSTSRGHQRRVITLNKTNTRVGGEHQKAQFNRTVTRKSVAHYNKNRNRHGRSYYNNSHGSYNRSYSPRHGGQRYRRHSNISIGIGYHSNRTHANVYYGSGYGHGYGSGYGRGSHDRHGGGYYSRTWVDPVYETCYDDYGYPYSKITRSGYYRNEWVARSCDQYDIRY